jgi:small subunit ribosomal protein S20
LANHKSSLKRIRSDKRKADRNRLVRSRMRTFVKKANKAIDSSESDAARKAVEDAIVELDKAVSKGIIHKNTAARKKSRLMKKLNDLS